MFCVTIAGQVQGKTQVAVTYHPILDELYTAVSGQGAFINGTRLKVSKTKNIKDALLSTGFVLQKKKSALHLEMSAFETLSRTARAVRRPGSAALDLAYTARGVFDGFWERHLSPWDVAAGALLIQEAGGRVTDFKNKSFSALGSEILATNGLLHSQIQKNI
jgi:myo-inositol-1(or 4)-monophosphatase